MRSMEQYRARRSPVFELVLFAMLGALAFASDLAMEILPNVHIVAMLIVVYTVVFGVKALFPIYIYVVLTVMFSGFSLWSLPYLYIWLPLWLMALAVPRTAPKWFKCVAYPVISAIHGLSFGLLYAPAEALFFGLDFNGALAWIAAGLSFDIIHTVSNFCFGLLIFPISELLLKLLNKRGYK